jgi:thiol-disulfide isomerase/thioredoxin
VIRRTILALLALSFLTPLAMAGEITTWDANRFSALQAEGRPILIHVTAPWCPTCRAQHPVVSDLAGAPENGDLVVFDIDFDSQKDVLRQLNVRQQSTLIAFRGADERGRAVGITDPKAIAALVAETR